MYLTKREKQLEEAHMKGEEDFNDNRKDENAYADDPVLKECYRKGWEMARKDYYGFCVIRDSW